jgi:hypothetical protein
MTAVLDPETLERLRKLRPEQAYREVTDAVYQSGSVGSEDFMDAYALLVESGILTWKQIEEFGGPEGA